MYLGRLLTSFLSAAALLLVAAQQLECQSDVALELQQIAFFGSPVADSSGFVSITDLAIGPDSLIYLLDSSRWRVQVYHHSGTYIRTIAVGRRGAACGRFLSPTALSVDSRGIIYVYDQGDGSLSVFQSDGRCLRRETLEANVHGVAGLEATSEGRLIISGQLHDSQAVLHMFSPEGKLIQSIAEESIGTPRLVPVHLPGSAGPIWMGDEGILIHARYPPLQIWQHSVKSPRIASGFSAEPVTFRRSESDHGFPATNDTAGTTATHLSSAYQLSSEIILTVFNDLATDQTTLLLLSSAGEIVGKASVSTRLVFLDYLPSGLAVGVSALRDDEVVVYSVRLASQSITGGEPE